MSKPISIYHGRFGRAAVHLLDRPLTKHAHREGHLVFQVRGTPCYTQVLEKRWMLAPDQGTAVNPWELHEFCPTDPNDGHLCLTLYIKPLWFLDFGRDTSSTLEFGCTGIEVTPTVSRLVNKVVSLLLDGFSAQMFDGHLYELTAECFEQSHSAQAMDPGATRLAFTDSRVRKSIALMTENLGDGIELHQIARESGLSRPHFFKLFRRHTGLTPHLFLNTLRAEKAIEQLTRTDHSVSDIGFDLGFSSQSSFTRFFSANVGMAPTTYRRVAHLLHT